MTAAHRVALVTGAARGIGAAVVRSLAADGWSVVAVDVCCDDPAVSYPLGTRDELEAVATAGDVVPVVADVRDQAAVDAAVATAEQRFGGLDVAVACAGVMVGGIPLWETADAQWDALHGVAVRGVFHVARAAVPALLRRPEPRSGRFIALASAAGHQGMWHLAAYNAAKHGVVGLVRGLAADLRGTGVSAVAVSPGSTDTPMLAASAELYGMDDPSAFADQQLVERLLAPEEVAATVCWLCSPAASAITGTVVHADGGLTA